MVRIFADFSLMLMVLNLGPGQTLSDITTDRDDYVTDVDINRSADFLNLSHHTQKRLLRGDSLGPQGKKFSDALYDFVCEESMDFVSKRASVCDMTETGTSVSGVVPAYSAPSSSSTSSFPLKIYSSTMPRAAETVCWDEFDYPVNELSTLNP